MWQAEYKRKGTRSSENSRALVLPLPCAPGSPSLMNLRSQEEREPQDGVRGRREGKSTQCCIDGELERC